MSSMWHVLSTIPSNSGSDTFLVAALSAAVGILTTFGAGLLAWFTKLNTSRREEMEAQQKWVSGLQESQQKALQEHDLVTTAMMSSVGEAIRSAAQSQAVSLGEVSRRLDVNTLVVQSAIAVQSATGHHVDPETLDRIIERVTRALSKK